MKAILEFDLPEEQVAFQQAVNGTVAHIVIENMFQELRKVWKYSDNEVEAEAAERWRDALAALCNEYNVMRD